MRKSYYDVVWYWCGDQWRAVEPGQFPEFLTVDGLVRDLESRGFVAKRGRRSIGQPEGPPSVAEPMGRAMDWSTALRRK